LQQREQRQRSEPRVFAGRRPAQRAQRKDVLVNLERVEKVASFVASHQRQQLVDGEIDRM